MGEEPNSAADPRPNGEPYYIDSECWECGGALVLKDEHEDNDKIWHDEWICPECEDGVYMDWPDRHFLNDYA